jgi:hypothetical protein
LVLGDDSPKIQHFVLLLQLLQLSDFHHFQGLGSAAAAAAAADYLRFLCCACIANGIQERAGFSALTGVSQMKKEKNKEVVLTDIAPKFKWSCLTCGELIEKKKHHGHHCASCILLMTAG